MSGAHPLWWIPAEMLERMRQELDLVVQRWAADWGVERPPSGTVAALSGDEWLSAASLRTSGSAAGPWVGRSDSLAATFLRLSFGADAGSAVATELSERAASALVEALRGGLPAQAAGVASPDEPHAHAPGHGGAVYRTPLGGETVEAFVSSAWLSACGWLQRPKRRTLAAWSPAQALAHLPVRLTVELGDADLTVGELSAIGADDVILVSRSSVDPIVIRADGTDVRIPAFLGRHGNVRAVQISPSSHKATS